VKRHNAAQQLAHSFPSLRLTKTDSSAARFLPNQTHTHRTGWNPRDILRAHKRLGCHSTPPRSITTFRQAVNPAAQTVDMVASRHSQ